MMNCDWINGMDFDGFGVIAALKPPDCKIISLINLIKLEGEEILPTGN